jgi:hypothetical protein
LYLPCKKVKVRDRIADKHESFHPTVNANLFAGATRKIKPTLYMELGEKKQPKQFTAHKTLISPRAE